MAGFTAERDMGTEGAGAADTAVRDAINQGLIPGPRLRISGNAVNILGGHEDAIGYNPEQHVLSNATYANNANELVTVIREQFKLGADFIKIYETGHDSFADGKFTTPYQYTEAELTAAVQEAARVGKRVAVHATGEPGTLYAARAGVVSIDHAYQLTDETMRLMHEKQIFAVPTFTISNISPITRPHPAGAARDRDMLELHAREFREAARRRRSHRHGLRRRSVSARHAGPRVRAHGQIRHDAAGRSSGRDAQRREAARLGRPDRRAEARLLRRHRRGAWKPAHRHQRPSEGHIRDEGRSGFPKVAE